jgi:formylglycine-generating enzyme required for sulfatase activity
MGSPANESGRGWDEVQHQVTITRDFWLKETEVTQGEWRSLMGNNPSSYSECGDRCPVETVSWWDAVKWCNARSERERLTPVYSIGGAVMRTGTGMPEADWSADGYRLPTEAEWERAARGGIAGVRFPWGIDMIAHQQANYFSSAAFFSYDTSVTRDFHPSHTSGGTPYTAPAGSFPGNGFGLGDLSGNVAEWCWDWYHSSHYLSSNGTTDPRGAAPSGYRVMRGGSWNSLATRCLDLIGNGLGWPDRAFIATRNRTTKSVYDDFGPSGRSLQRAFAANAIATACNQNDFTV